MIQTRRNSSINALCLRCEKFFFPRLKQKSTTSASNVIGRACLHARCATRARGTPQNSQDRNRRLHTHAHTYMRIGIHAATRNDVPESESRMTETKRIARHAPIHIASIHTCDRVSSLAHACVYTCARRLARKCVYASCTYEIIYIYIYIYRVSTKHSPRLTVRGSWTTSSR